MKTAVIFFLTLWANLAQAIPTGSPNPDRPTLATEDPVLVQKVPGRASSAVPTPAMALTLDIVQDPRDWRIAGQPESNTTYILAELTPNGEPVESWNELSTSIIVFQRTLKEYVEPWAQSLERAGATILENQILEDGSQLVRYSSSDENGIWRFLQGPDAVYGISYQTRPKSENPQTLELWKGIIRQVGLVQNPYASDTP
jgi:hypothetical protein